MTKGSLLPKIIKFCIPLVFTNLLQVFYNAADIIVAGRFAGEHALAAIGSSAQIFALFTSLFIGMSLGANVVISQQIGEGNRKGVENSVHTSVALSTTFGVFIAIAGYFFSKNLLLLTNCNADVLDQASLYLKILFLGMPAQMVYNYCAAILLSIGDTKHPLYFLSISGVLNIILNIIMVVCFKKAADGVAIATVISQYLSVILILRLLIKDKGICHLNIKKIKFHYKSLKNIILIGLPTGLQSCAFSLSNVVIQGAINSFGTSVVAGSTAASNIESFFYTACDAVYSAGLAFTGQNVGAKNTNRIKRVAKDCILVQFVLCAVLGAVGIIFSSQLLSIYLPNSPKATVAGKERLIIFASCMFICSLMNLFSRMCNGMGKSLASMFITLIGACALRVVWVYTILPIHRTFTLLMICMPVSWLITGIANFIYYLHCKKQLSKQFELERNLTK